MLLKEAAAQHNARHGRDVLQAALGLVAVVVCNIIDASQANHRPAKKGGGGGVERERGRADISRKRDAENPRRSL